MRERADMVQTAKAVRTPSLGLALSGALPVAAPPAVATDGASTADIRQPDPSDCSQS
jgi:hypothetical protein